MPRGEMIQVVEITASVPRDFEIEFWYARPLEEMPESEQDHVREELETGCTSGQLLYDDGDGHVNEGWWNIKPEDE